jgi:hypothetical protein
MAPISSRLARLERGSDPAFTTKRPCLGQMAFAKALVNATLAWVSLSSSDSTSRPR